MDRILFLLWMASGVAAVVIAARKGRRGCLWYIIGIPAGVLSLAAAAALPARREPAVAAADLRPCPYCAEPIRPQASKCRFCGSTVVPLAPLVESHPAAPIDRAATTSAASVAIRPAGRDFLRSAALAFAVVSILLGLAGFVPLLVQPPNPEHPKLVLRAGYGLLFGLFPVNALEDLLYVLIGAWGLSAYAGLTLPRRYFKRLALLFLALMLAGFVPGPDSVFGLMPLFSNDIWLYALLALATAAIGWFEAEPVATAGGTGA